MSVTRRGLRLPRYVGGTVKAGVLSGATYPNEPIKDANGNLRPDPRAGMHVATIAAALEYGNRQNHPRPFMQTTVAREKDKWRDNLLTLARSKMPLPHVLMTVGQIMKEDIQQTITDWPADNAPTWAAMKGFNHGLIWTSHLLKSIESEMQA